MKRYVIRRLLMAIPLLLAISFVCFVFINLIPSNPAEVVLRIQQTPIITDEAIAEMEEALGLNKPFLVRYFDWVLGCLQGDFGISYVNPARTVAGELARCLPATLQLAAASFVIVLLLSIPIGFLCAVYKDGWFDKIMRGLVFISTAMPAYWVGLLLMWGISVKLGLLPTNGNGPWQHIPGRGWGRCASVPSSIVICRSSRLMCCSSAYCSWYSIWCSTSFRPCPTPD